MQVSGPVVRINVSDGIFLRFKEILLREDKTIRDVLGEFVLQYVRERTTKKDYDAYVKMGARDGSKKRGYTKKNPAT